MLGWFGVVFWRGEVKHYDLVEKDADTAEEYLCYHKL